MKIPKGYKLCRKCNTIKPVSEFGWANKSKGQRHSWCKACHIVYNKSPAGKAASKKYRQSPKGKAYHLEYSRTPKCKAKQAEYEKSPKKKAYKKKYYALPRVKRYYKKYNSEFNHTPKRKASKAAYAKTPKCKAIRRAYNKTPKAKQIFKISCARRRADKIKRIPKWSDQKAVDKFYANCPKGCEVDHIIPLRGKLVSGLHVLNNLQYLLKKVHKFKLNKFDPIKFNNLKPLKSSK